MCFFTIIRNYVLMCRQMPRRINDIWVTLCTSHWEAIDRCHCHVLRIYLMYRSNLIMAISLWDICENVFSQIITKLCSVFWTEINCFTLEIYSFINSERSGVSWDRQDVTRPQEFGRLTQLSSGNDWCDLICLQSVWKVFTL